MNNVNYFQLEDVVAERVLEAAKGGNSYVATVSVGRPVKSADACAYQCPYQVAGIGDDVIRLAYGEDSMQALELAIRMVSIEIYIRYKEFTFTWIGEPDLGFPKPDG